MNRCSGTWIRVFLCAAGLMAAGACQTERTPARARVDFAALLRDAKAEQRQMIEACVRAQKFGVTLPRLEGGALAKFTPQELTESQRREIREAVAAELMQDTKSIVYPEWIKFRCTKLDAVVSAAIAEAAKAAAANDFDRARAVFDRARESMWNEGDSAVLDGKPVPEVNVPTHAYAMKMLVGRINVAHWPMIEREMCKIVDDSLSAAKPEDGVKALADVPWIRAYTVRLDEHVSAFTAALARQGVPTPATEAIQLATHDFMCEAAKLADRVDEVRHDRKLLKSGRPAPDDSGVRKLLDAYHEALLKYGCTEANARRLTEWMGRKVTELYEDLPQKTDDVYGSVTTTVKLGTTALNDRIKALRGRLVSRLNVEIAKNEKIRAQLEDMLSRDPKKARDRVVAMLTGAVEAGESERAMAKYELLTRINPTLWSSIQKEIYAKVGEFVKSEKCSEGISWLQAYPRVRTYPEEIDEQYGKICAAAVDMGVPKDRAAEIIERIAAATAEVEYLASYEDLEKPGVKPGIKIPAAKTAEYEQAVKRGRLVLVRNGCKISNAEDLIGEIHAAFSNETAKLESSVSSPIYYLGANAINVKLAKLKKDAALTMLSRYAAARLEANDADGARRTIRTIRLTGDADFDAEVYAVRLGVVNALINPHMLNTLKPQVEAKVAAFCRVEDYIGLKKWIGEYPFVHDRSEDIARSLQEIRKGMLALKVDGGQVAEYVDRLDGRLQELIDAAKGGRDPEISRGDLAWLEHELSVLERSLLQQYYDPKICATICQGVRREVVARIEKPHGSVLTTSELNARLRAAMEAKARAEIAVAIGRRPKFRMLPEPTEADAVRDVLVGAAQKGLVALAAGKKKDEIVAEMAGGVNDSTVAWVMKLCDDINRGRDTVAADALPSMDFAQLLDRLIERQRYLEYLAEVDRTISYDSQISMAEDAIAQQLDAEPEEASLRVNALLGEYARAMRFLKMGQKLDKRLGAGMLVGAVCLDQSAVVESALELGVPIDVTCPLDPDRRTALLLAVQLGRDGLIHKLASRGANARCVDAGGNTVLHYAARRGNVAVLKAFVGQQDVNAVNAAGETAIFEAARVDSKQGVEALVAAKANVNAVATNGLNAVGAACAAGSCSVLDPLADAGAGFGVEQLVVAVSAGRLEAVKWLVGKGVDVNGTGVMAASANRPLVRDYLLRQGGIGSRTVVAVPVRAETADEQANVKMHLEVETARGGAVTVGK